MEGVVELEPANYGQVIGQSKYVFLEFYATWCGHCQKFAPVFARLAVLVQQDATLRDKVILGKMDSGHIRELASDFGVTGYPSLFLVQPFQKMGFLYKGWRTDDAMMDYLRGAVK
ncbi:protein disulfide isomerase [Trypanosoma conorhini]|uniref:Protein disulfide isomerase n=1 Tax=Trypanosoma conorhini TaxID=83891 RepID=A0A3S5ISL7_9TRYP|nr:protein disulfide isomerase [Trypanosoma conorhini]RNF12068.1 protein disulfide isomerase [Trypanosoma conorhini]